ASAAGVMVMGDLPGIPNMAASDRACLGSNIGARGVALNPQDEFTAHLRRSDDPFTPAWHG
ncbi:MAG: hypothetical protein Q4G49_17910, partial [Paracoccus sp. (in: a-proteobacteria)]|nr:hypothetical protein [Paracoccus sp. (in: a-proteobacteria)]